MSGKNSIKKSRHKINSFPRCVMFIQVACLWMCVLLYFSFVCLYVCAYAFEFTVHCGSAIEPGASRLHYYYTPPVCIPAVIGGLAVCVLLCFIKPILGNRYVRSWGFIVSEPRETHLWRHNNKKKGPWS